MAMQLISIKLAAIALCICIAAALALAAMSGMGIGISIAIVIFAMLANGALASLEDEALGGINQAVDENSSPGAKRKLRFFRTIVWAAFTALLLWLAYLWLTK